VRWNFLLRKYAIDGGWQIPLPKKRNDYLTKIKYDTEVVCRKLLIDSGLLASLLIDAHSNNLGGTRLVDCVFLVGALF